MKELQKCFGEIYLEKKITTDSLFIILNIRINCHMAVAEFEGLLYTIFSEEPFNNQRMNTT